MWERVGCPGLHGCGGGAWEGGREGVGAARPQVLSFTERSCRQAPTRLPSRVCMMFSQAARENGHCQMHLVSGDFLVCRWAGKGLSQRAETVTLPWASGGGPRGLFSRSAVQLCFWSAGPGPGPGEEQGVPPAGPVHTGGTGPTVNGCLSVLPDLDFPFLFFFKSDFC